MLYNRVRIYLLLFKRIRIRKLVSKLINFLKVLVIYHIEGSL